MDPAVLPSPLACVRHLLVMVYLLECTCRCQTEPECGCREVPLVALTAPETNNCFPIGKRFRYTCVAGYARKAGTSNLIWCKDTRQWSDPMLQCIVNPLNPPPKSTVSPVNQTIEFTPEKTETPPSELTSTDLPLLHTTETSLESTTPQTKTPLETALGTSQTSKSPDSSTVSSSSTSAPVSPLLSTSTASSTWTTRRSRILDRTTSPSDSSSNSTSSLQPGSPADATKVVAPVVVGIILVAVAVAGGVWFLHRRKSRNRPKTNGVEASTAEERIPMQTPDGHT